MIGNIGIYFQTLKFLIGWRILQLLLYLFLFFKIIVSLNINIQD